MLIVSSLMSTLLYPEHTAIPKYNHIRVLTLILYISNPLLRILYSPSNQPRSSKCVSSLNNQSHWQRSSSLCQPMQLQFPWKITRLISLRLSQLQTTILLSVIKFRLTHHQTILSTSVAVAVCHGSSRALKLYIYSHIAP
jgi:hypothetical protein